MSKVVLTGRIANVTLPWTAAYAYYFQIEAFNENGISERMSPMKVE